MLGVKKLYSISAWVWSFLVFTFIRKSEYENWKCFSPIEKSDQSFPGMKNTIVAPHFSKNATGLGGWKNHIHEKRGLGYVIGRDWDKNIHVFVFGISKATDLLRAGFFSFVAFNLSKQEEEGNNVLLWRISAVQAKSFHK